MFSTFCQDIERIFTTAALNYNLQRCRISFLPNPKAKIMVQISYLTNQPKFPICFPYNIRTCHPLDIFRSK